MLHSIEVHEEDQSKHNYYIDQRKIEYILPKEISFVKFGKQIVTKNLKTSKRDCQEDNSIKLTSCLNNFYARKLGCILPWVQENGEKCKGKEKFEEFRNLTKGIEEPEIQKELLDQRCTIPNCHRRTWTIDSTKMVDFNHAQGGNQSSSEIWYNFPRNTQVLVRNEILLYTFSSFIADVGGFLGLLLGESLVSYILMVTNMMKKLF